ncbi:MAG: 3-phosphoshikimate 1-carboxyvinyltransferase [Tannerella sp.]|jgi:3-phosphoshikimate 1-carboxyvinyltransferase|nr:3-phosphoshikimate 1-carboxyvinyltransferase [Tannerella sp.]
MDFLIKAPEGKLRTTVNLPASKSISNRVLILNMLSDSPQEVSNLSDCDDTVAMLGALRSESSVIDVGAAGTAMRFLTAYLAGKEGVRTLTGSERMKNRPIGLLVDALRALGADIEYLEKEGFPPLRINGHRLRGGEISIDGGVSSQYISALLMAAPLMTEGLKLHIVNRLSSRPYISQTIKLMQKFGVEVDECGDAFIVAPQQYKPVPYTVEPDWSAASYWYEAAALADEAEVDIVDLSVSGLQGDEAIIPLFAHLGVDTLVMPNGVLLQRRLPERMTVFKHDFTDMPDMAQTLTVTCAAIGMPFVFSGLQSLKIKETDRLTALVNEFRKFGYPMRDSADSLEWDGRQTRISASPIVETYKDHRMAMSFVPWALRRSEGVMIADAGVVSKSYPRFWDDLRAAGFIITEI